MMQKLLLPAPAKVNLFLHILNRRADGYHNIQTVFQFLDLSDVLAFQLRGDSKIELQSDHKIPIEDNLIYKAAQLFQQATNIKKGIDIEFNKRIPMGAGLGGGSSDAATTLLALNHLWETGWSLNQLAELGKKIGADVPVFVYGHSAWAEGIGDVLTPILLPEPWYLLIIPPCKIQTQAMYTDPRLNRDSVKLHIDQFHPGLGHNDFEKIVRMDYPEVARALDWLDQFSKAKMTGSGSVVFAMFDTREEASRIAARVPTDYQSVVSKGLNRSPLHAAL